MERGISGCRASFPGPGRLAGPRRGATPWSTRHVASPVQHLVASPARPHKPQAAPPTTSCSRCLPCTTSSRTSARRCRLASAPACSTSSCSASKRWVRPQGQQRAHPRRHGQGAAALGPRGSVPWRASVVVARIAPRPAAAAAAGRPPPNPTAAEPPGLQQAQGRLAARAAPPRLPFPCPPAGPGGAAVRRGAAAALVGDVQPPHAAVHLEPQHGRQAQRRAAHRRARHRQQGGGGHAAGGYCGVGTPGWVLHGYRLGRCMGTGPPVLWGPGW
jgi:hypothetical protein